MSQLADHRSTNSSEIKKNICHFKALFFEKNDRTCFVLDLSGSIHIPSFCLGFKTSFSSRKSQFLVCALIYLRMDSCFSLVGGKFEVLATPYVFLFVFFLSRPSSFFTCGSSKGDIHCSKNFWEWRQIDITSELATKTVAVGIYLQTQICTL